MCQTSPPAGRSGGKADAADLKSAGGLNLRVGSNPASGTKYKCSSDGRERRTDVAGKTIRRPPTIPYGKATGWTTGSGFGRLAA